MAQDFSKNLYAVALPSFAYIGHVSGLIVAVLRSLKSAASISRVCSGYVFCEQLYAMMPNPSKLSDEQMHIFYESFS